MKGEYGEYAPVSYRNRESCPGCDHSPPPHLKRRVKAAFRAVADNPHQAKPLKDELTGLRSYRVGRNRLVMRIKGSVIEMVAFGPRSTIYERAAAELSISLRAKDENDE